MSENKHVPGGIKEIWTMSYPIILSAASHTIMRFVDRMMLSWKSEEDIAASVPSGITAFTFICLFVGIAGYTNTLIAQYYGAKNNKYLSISLWQGIYFSIFATVIIILLTPLGNLIIANSGHLPEIIEKEHIYFTVLMMGGGLVVLNSALASFFTGRSDTKTTLYVNLIGNTLNIVLDYCLIFGNWGFPELGIFGAGIATVLSLVVISLLYFLVIFRKKFKLEYGVTKYYKFDVHIFRKLLKYGTPSGIEFMLVMASFTAFVFIIGNIGHDELVATNIVLTIDMLAFMPMIGLGIGTSALVGQYIGRNQKDISIKVTYNSIKLVLLYSALMGLLFLSIPEFFLQFFVKQGETNLEELMFHAGPLIKVLSIFLIMDGVVIILSSSLSGAGDTLFKMVCYILTSWLIFVPGVWVILMVLQLPVVYAWLWGAVELFLLALILFWRFNSGSWKTIDLMSTKVKMAPSDI